MSWKDKKEGRKGVQERYMEKRALGCEEEGDETQLMLNKTAQVREMWESGVACRVAAQPLGGWRSKLGQAWCPEEGHAGGGSPAGPSVLLRRTSLLRCCSMGHVEIWPPERRF